MRCDWQSFIKLTPAWMHDFLNTHGKDTLLELRLRLGLQPELVTSGGSLWIHNPVTKSDLVFCINAASRYSPWATATIADGYITAQGGHRIGICGTAAVTDRTVRSVREPTSVCMRVARDFPGIASGMDKIGGSVLIVGKPGSGKTTLLRDMIRRRSNNGTGSIAVVDEKCELFPMEGEKFWFSPGMRTDILSGCSKPQGIEMVLRNMGPSMIAVDEITAAEDCAALHHAAWCGVKVLAAAHAENRRDLYSRDVYRPIITSGIFDVLVFMLPDKSWRMERMNQ